MTDRRPVSERAGRRINIMKETMIRRFTEIRKDDVADVGGKNASLGEMFSQLSEAGVRVPDGFATTSEAYRLFIERNSLAEPIGRELSRLETESWENLSSVGEACRRLISDGAMPEELTDAIREGYNTLIGQYGSGISLAVRSSATAEDLPSASFAGQQESYLNVRGIDNLLDACHRCFASLYTDRAIKYRVDNGFGHLSVALSVGVQLMVRSDKASAGVMFTLDPDSGFENVILISGSWGLGENVVKGNVTADEFLVFKPTLATAERPVIARTLGSKRHTMVYADEGTDSSSRSGETVKNLETPPDRARSFVLSDDEVRKLAEWGMAIQNHYGRHMDIEWAKDGLSEELFIVQARPETVFSGNRPEAAYTEYVVKERGPVLCKGMGLGHRVAVGTARVLGSPDEIDRLKPGEILVTVRTDPDWDPVLGRAAAVVTEQGGRTSHAAIVAREMGAVAVIGTGNATEVIRNGQEITVSAAEGETGLVYDGRVEWEERQVDLKGFCKPDTGIMLILGHPDRAFELSSLPVDGVGLMRMEFIISNAVRIHPMALKHFDNLKDANAKEEIERITSGYADKEEYFLRVLSEATARIAAAFFPRDVIVRMSDFKSNEYAGLIGGAEFEPPESNPMIGFRGASRYYHPAYRDGFELECRAMKRVRDEMGLVNVKLMIPFCRTVEEGRKVIDLMEEYGLKRGENGLEVYVMIEIPSNALRAEEFAECFDGFSIGSNDLTQLTLGADRDSELLSEIFSPFDPAVRELIAMTVRKAKEAGIKVGLCGQAPSDYPEYARFLVGLGIDSISFNPDVLLRGIENVCKAEEGRSSE